MAAVEIDLRYDAAKLAKLKVEPGPLLQSALTAINDQVPGVLRVGAVSTKELAGDGVLLSLRAESPAELAVTAFSIKALDAGGKPLTVSTHWAGSLLPPVTVSDSPLKVEPPPSPIYQQVMPRGTTVFVNPGQDLPSSQTPNKVLPVAESLPVSLPGSLVTPAFPAIMVPHSDKRLYSPDSMISEIAALPRPWTLGQVQERFRERAAAAKVRQEPLVVLADGHSRLNLWLAKKISRVRPAVAVEGCKVDGIFDAGEQGWRVELVTYRGVWSAQIILLGEEEMLKLPLVIVPALNLPSEVSATKEYEQIPNVDLNADGVADATDAYLLVGSLLATLSEKR